MRMLFCNIGWMERYQGVEDGDQIARGGEYNRENNGHEIYNFYPHRGMCYGYVKAVNLKIKIENIGKSEPEADCIKHVTVVWTAGPPDGGTVIIGWYKDATVYRELQNIPRPTLAQRKHGIDSYIIKTDKKNAILLRPEDRKFRIHRGKGGIGQSNVWYAKEAKELRKEVALYIDGHHFPIPDVDYEAFEGSQRMKRHFSRERNQRIVEEKKKDVLNKTEKLLCEVCGFDFHSFYGERGENFCEVHHLAALSETGETKTKLSDLAIVCSNCHRMIHREKKMLSIEELKKIVNKQRNV